MAETWRSPRKVEEEIREYQHARFEAYMRLEDDGVLTRALAIAALKDELESGLFIPTGDENARTSSDARS